MFPLVRYLVCRIKVKLRERERERERERSVIKKGRKEYLDLSRKKARKNVNDD
jgi:hypothetical protein